MNIVKVVNQHHLILRIKNEMPLLITISFLIYSPLFVSAQEQQQPSSPIMIGSSNEFNFGEHQLGVEASKNVSSGESRITYAGIGEGSIIYSAHRSPGNWDNCFAIYCNTGRGPGVTMFFTVYNSSNQRVASGQADENGVLIKGLDIGSTYFIIPQNCVNCNHSPHDVLFDHWQDCSTIQKRPFKITSASQVPIAAAYYRIWWYGSTDKPSACTLPNGLLTR